MLKVSSAVSAIIAESSSIWAVSSTTELDGMERLTISSPPLSVRESVIGVVVLGGFSFICPVPMSSEIVGELLPDVLVEEN